MTPIFRYTAVIIILMLTSVHALILPVEAMSGLRPVNPIIELAQKDAKRDVGVGSNLRWFAYGTGCWVFAVVHASVKNPTVPSDRLLGKTPGYVKTYTDEYKRSVKNQWMEMSAIGWGVSLAATFWLWNIFTD